MAIRRILLAYVLIIALILISLNIMINIHAQSGDDAVTTALKGAMQVLAKKLGKPVPTIDNYTYSIDTFQDTSYGCPDPGKNYISATIQAYKFLITVKGISYDVRVTLDGVQGVVCAGTDIKQDSSLASYRNSQFTISYPQQWSIVNRTTDIFFGLGPVPVCAQPGMIVTVLGQMMPDKTPDSLIDDYLTTITGEKPLGDRTNVSNVGHSLIFTSPCTDGSSRQSRVITFIFYGHGYRIVEFAPQTAFSQWADIFEKIAESFSPGITSQGANGQDVSDVAQPPSAYLVHVFAGNVYISTLDDMPGTPVTTDAVGNHYYSSPVFSPKGDQVAFIEQTNTQSFVDVASVGGTPHQLTIPDPSVYTLIQGFPPAWSTDSKHTIFMASNKKTGAGADIMTIGVDGKNPQVLLHLPGQPGVCGAAVPDDPADRVYWSATGLDANTPLLAVLADNTVLFSPTCEGIGVQRITPGETSPTTINDKLRRVHISPDGKTLLGLIDNNGATKLVSVAISDGTMTEIPTAATPEQAIWNTNGAAVFYSTATVKNVITLDDPTLEKRVEAQGIAWPFKTTVYSISLHRIDVRTNDDLVLYQGEGRAISQIAPSPDGQGVLFSLVQSASNLAEAFKNNTSLSDLKRQYPVMQLYWLPLSSAQPQLVAVTSDPEWGPIIPGIN